MATNQAKCRTCHVQILAATGKRTGGLCMPCSQGARYQHVAYLTIQDFFAKATGEDCLAPNLEPHPSNEAFQASLEELSEEPGVNRCIIPVDEYQEPDEEQEPYSDRVFVGGAVEENVIERWARKLGAECYRQERPEAVIPMEFCKGERGWFLVWD
jgi:hypothetical protein